MSIRSVSQVIGKVKESIRSQRADLENSELRTRTVLIDPVLRALGWEVSDPTLVRLELGLNGGFADYALFDPTGAENPSIIIEAKKLGIEKLVPVKLQIARYASGASTAALRVVITNGNLWHVYENTTGPMIGRSLMAISVTGDAPDECAKELVRVLSPRKIRRRFPHPPPPDSGEMNPNQDSPTGGIPVTDPLFDGAYGSLFLHQTINPNE